VREYEFGHALSLRMRREAQELVLVILPERVGKHGN